VAKLHKFEKLIWRIEPQRYGEFAGILGTNVRV
jgi:hypothetical protein